MYDPPDRPVAMNNFERRQFVQKAKADSLAYDAAQLLSLGEASKAVTLAGECMALAGPEQFTRWLRHYATTRFKIPCGTVDDFLGTVPPTNVAL